MAKKLEKSQNVQKGEPVEVNSIRNLTGFDGEQLVADIDKTLSLVGDAKEASTPIADHKKVLKSERGYHMGGFAVCMKLARMEPAEARDFWMTVRAYADHVGLTSPDLVDQMETA